MESSLRQIRFYRPRFVTTTEGAVMQKDYTKTEIQILVKTEDGEEWRPIPVIEVQEG